MRISSNFDSGNIKVLDCSDAGNVRLEINSDNESHFFQWFHFRASGVRDKECCFHITNAGEAAYTDGWVDYNVVASYDRETWFRVPTDYEDGVLSFEHEPEVDAVYYAYFAPYSMERHADLVAAAQNTPIAEVSVLGHTLDGQDMDLIRLGEPEDGKKVCWFIARQHPGETMAEWWMEGFLDRMLDEDDPVAKALLRKAVFYVVPNMNPDGSRRGHLRTNAVGANLNREWVDTNMERSPEVFYVREKMRETGVDFCLDVHGDEGLPYNFISGSEGIPSWSQQQREWLDAYLEALVIASPDFQTKHGYDIDEPGTANLTMATNYIAEHFKCLSMTLEMPFKDTADTPDEEFGWSPARSRILGKACIDALYRLIDTL